MRAPVKYSLVLASVALLAATGCGKHEKPNFIYMPDMVYQPSLKAQEEGAMRVPPKGTIPRGYQPYAFSHAANAEAAGSNRNPLPRDAKTFARGQQQFNTYCIVCHGPNGEGDGFIVPKYPRPPSLQSDKVRGWADGSIYHVITMGQNLMPSYALQIAPEDRWAIIHYVRALQRSKHPTPEDVKAYEQQEGK
jgi:mono/diheme cytochrome c family protein